MPFEIVRNDITKMRADAIVNAANNSLLGGGGVDGAIHRAAGPQLLAECRGLGGCETGNAKITGAYRLPCRFVIHTVGPVWQGGGQNEAALLYSCYRRSMELACENGCESIAFPLISAGAYGYPKAEALAVATSAIRDFLLDHELWVYLVVYDRASFVLSSRLMANIQAFIDDGAIPPDFEETQKMRALRAEALHGMAPPAAAQQSAAKKKKRLLHPGAALTNAWKTIEEAEPAPGLEAYLTQMDESFRDMLLRKIDEQGITDAACYKRANIDRKLFNKIKNQKDYRPGKPTVLAFAVALRLPLEETREMLMKAGYSLSHSSRFDLIVEYFIRQGVYDIFEINQALFAFDQGLLGTAAQM